MCMCNYCYMYIGFQGEHTPPAPLRDMPANAYMYVGRVLSSGGGGGGGRGEVSPPKTKYSVLLTCQMSL